MNLKKTIFLKFRRIVRWVLSITTPIFLKFYPVHWSWKRKSLASAGFLKNINAQGLETQEYSLYSQNGEDGILKYIFSQIDVSSKLFLEFGFGVVENNSLQLILKESWGGVLIDGSAASVQSFNKAIRKMNIVNVHAIQQFLDLENLKPTILESGLPEDIDFLSIDVDGNDYWFWKDITYLRPRVVVIEYNASLGDELSLTVPYDPFFERYVKHPSGFYHGASLTALTRLAAQKEYSLVGCDSNGVNAFFIRRDCLTGFVKELQPSTAYRLNKTRVKNGNSPVSQFDMIKNMPYVVVE